MLLTNGCHLIYWNLQHLLPIDIIGDSKHVTCIFGMKNMLQLSELKSAIVQLNTIQHSNYCDCYAENVDSRNTYIRLCCGTLGFWEILLCAAEMLMPAMRKSRPSEVVCVSWLQAILDQLINFYQIDANPALSPLHGAVNARTLFSQERFNYETRRPACRRRNRISMVTWCRRNCCRTSYDQHRLSELRAGQPSCLEPRSPSLEMRRWRAVRSQQAGADLSKKVVFGLQEVRTDGRTGVLGSRTTGKDL